MGEIKCAPSHLYVRRVPLTVPPGACDAREGAVRVVELVAVGTEEECRVGLLRRRKKNKTPLQYTDLLYFFKNLPRLTQNAKCEQAQRSFIVILFCRVLQRAIVAAQPRGEFIRGSS